LNCHNGLAQKSQQGRAEIRRTGGVVFAGLLRLSAVMVLSLMACSACATTPSPSATPSQSPLPSEQPSPAGPPQRCDARELSLSPGAWGAAAGTSYVVVHVDLVSGSACLIPGGPAVTLLDRDGKLLASAAGITDPDVIVASRTDLRLGWSSWCGPPPANPIRLRLDLPSGPLNTPLPGGFLASCQQVPTVIEIEVVQP
jgi:hypothetical protein